MLRQKHGSKLYQMLVGREVCQFVGHSFFLPCIRNSRFWDLSFDAEKGAMVYIDSFLFRKIDRER